MYYILLDLEAREIAKIINVKDQDYVASDRDMKTIIRIPFETREDALEFITGRMEPSWISSEIEKEIITVAKNQEDVLKLLGILKKNIY